MMKKHAVHIQEKASAITGCNVGPYPLHKFNVSPEPPTEFPLRLLAAGDDEWVAGCWRRRSRSNTFAVEFVCGGVFHYTQNGRQYDVVPGEAFLVHLGADNEMSTDAPAVKKTMIMNGHALSAILRQLGLDSADVVKVARAGRFAALFDRARDACGGGPGRVQEASALGYQALLELAEEHSNRKFPAVLNDLVRYMQEHLGEPLTMETLCGQSGMSRAALHRMFVQHMECAPVEFLLRQRIARARELLVCPWYSIKEVAELTGYSNQLYFSAEFKKRCGVSPKAFRKGS
jgi:AraC-like DNA-binding protein